MGHQQVFDLSEKGLPLRQIFSQPMWLQLVHDSNWQNHKDINSVPLPCHKLKQNFWINDFLLHYLKSPYQKTLLVYLQEIFGKNKHKIPLSKKIRNLISLITLSIPQKYLEISLKIKRWQHPTPSLNIETIKAMCMERKTYWRKPLKNT